MWELLGALLKMCVIFTVFLADRIQVREEQTYLGNECYYAL